ncbi:MAG TPA: penicillin-binding protein activator LpoB [Nitrospirales bacterium]|nr:penicillin-binding protein activator LpoB [Nitrospirales bacterium]
MNRFAALGMIMLTTVALAGCGSGQKVTRTDTDLVTDLSGRWNDTDSRLVAEAMVKDAMTYPWLEKYTRTKGRQPVVVVGTISNKSHEHISTDTFIADIERALVNSDKVTFVSGRGERDEIREERKEQAVHAREDTQKSPGKELGADFIMKGVISTIPDESEGIKAMYYQVDLELVDLESNVKSWFGQKKIKKVIERKRVLF